MRYLILGAGPAGLAFANKIYRNGVDSFIVLEQEGEAGGLCRSAEVDGFPLDIGGGISWIYNIRMSVSFYLNLCRRMSGKDIAKTPKL